MDTNEVVQSGNVTGSHLPSMLEPTFTKVVVTLESNGGDIDYDLIYCEANGKICKWDHQVIKKGFQIWYLIIGIGTICIVLGGAGALSYYLLYWHKQHSKATKDTDEVKPPENIQTEEFEPYDELELPEQAGQMYQ